MIYLDAASAYPPLKCVRDAVLEASTIIGNHQSQHAYGRFMQVEIDALRRTIAHKHNVDSSQITFTNGGSDGIYRTLTSLIPHLQHAHILLSPLLYPSFYDILSSLQPFTHHTIHMLEVDNNGQYVIDNLKSQYDFIMIETVNSELGIQQKSLQTLFSNVMGCYIIDDCAGLLERLLEPLDIPQYIQYRCIYTAEKLGSVSGTGYMITSQNSIIKPLTKHSGTHNFVGLMALKASYEHLLDALDSYQQHIKKLSTMLVNTIQQCNNWHIVIDNEYRNYGIITLSHSNYSGAILQHMLEEKGILVGTGYACESGSMRVSRAMEAIKYHHHNPHNIIRISLHHSLTEADITTVGAVLGNI